MDYSIFKDPNTVMLVVSALVYKLGGMAEITQSDIDSIAFGLLVEEETDTGVLFTLSPRDERIQ